MFQLLLLPVLIFSVWPITILVILDCLAEHRTKEILDSVGINYGGLVEHPWSIFRKDSVLYGFCAFAPNAGTVNLNETEKAAADCKNAC